MLKPNLYIVTLAVDDLDRSAAFYRDGLGLGTGAHGGDHVLFELQGELALVVFLRPEFNKTAGQSNSSASDSGISLTYQADSADEVDGLLRRSVQAIVQYVADRGDCGRPTAAVRRFYPELLDPADRKRSVAAEGQWRRVVRGTAV